MAIWGNSYVPPAVRFRQDKKVVTSCVGNHLTINDIFITHYDRNITNIQTNKITNIKKFDTIV